MNELLKVNYGNDRITLSARELHGFLGIGTQYTKWFDRMSEYGFYENVDYQAISQKRLTAQGNETTYIDHEITLDMAKEIAMIQRSDKGKEVRQYFLELERRWNSPEAVMNRALEYSRRQVKALMDENKELKPKADYCDLILQSKALVNISQIAKDYGMSGKAMNKLLHDLGVNISNQINGYSIASIKTVDTHILKQLILQEAMVYQM